MAVELLILFALILVNGFFSMAEMAVVSSRKARLRHEAQNGKKNYRLALETAEAPSRFLSTIQVVITLIGTLTGAFGGATVAVALEEAFSKVGWLAAIASPLAFGIVVVLTAFVSVIFGELVPKSLALSRPETIAAGIIRPVRGLARMFSPVVRLLSATTDLVVRILGFHETSEPVVTEDEVKVLIAQGAEEGVFDDREREMVEGVLALGDIRVTSLMTPRPELVYLDRSASLAHARQRVIENVRYGYLPVVDKDLDHVIGMLPVKDALAAIVEGSFLSLEGFTRKPVYVPESLTALEAISAIKAGQVRTALIIDEYGGVSGLVSLSDLIESVVGDIPQTGAGEEPGMVQRSDGSWLVDGSLPIADFFDTLGVDVPEEDRVYETVAGLVLDRMGSIPRAGETCRWDGCLIEVMDMDDNRIDKVLVSKVPEADEEERTEK